jgi:hypothetical protein
MPEVTEVSEPTLESLLGKLKELFAETKKASVRCEAIRLSKKMFERSARNGITTPQELFTHSCRLMAELRRTGQNKLFQEAIAINDGILDFIRREKFPNLEKESKRVDDFFGE